MFWSLIQKDIFHFIRMKRELLILLLMPAVLIAILGFSLGSFLDSEAPPLQMELAVIQEGDPKEDWERFKQEIARSPLPKEAQDMILIQAENSLPTDLLVNQILQREELKESITIHKMSGKEKEAVQKDDRYTAFLIIPKEYDYALLRSLYLGEEEGVSLKLELNEEDSLKEAWLKGILEFYQEQINFSRLLSSMAAEKGADLSFDSSLEQKFALEGEAVSLKGREPLSSFAYYAIGMSVMFVLYTAGYMSQVALKEKKSGVLERTLLAQVPMWKFLMSKWLSTSIVVIIQVLLLYGYTAIAFQIYWPDLFSFLLVTMLLGLVVGGIAVLLIVLSYRFNSSSLETIYSSGIVTILALFGGSFVRVDQFLGNLAVIGSWTPNGAALNAYMKVMQGYSLSELSFSLLVLLTYVVVLLLLTFFVHERRGVR